MAFFANQEDIPPSLDSFPDSPFLNYPHSTEEADPQIPPLKTPINPLFPLDLSTDLTPALDTLGIDIDFETSISHHRPHPSQNKIQFPENINPQHKSIIEGMLKTNWSPGDLEGQENSIIMMDNSGIPSDSSPPLASSTPVPLSILHPDETAEGGGAHISARDEDDNRSITFENIEFVPEDTTELSQDIEFEDRGILVPVPTTPTLALGIRRTVTRSQSMVKKMPLQRKEEEEEDAKPIPQTEPRRPVKGILKTPIVPLSASGLRKKAGQSTGNTHRSWGWYDSRSFSPLDGYESQSKKGAKVGKKKGNGNGKKVKIDEVVDERILSSEESEVGPSEPEGWKPEPCLIESTDESEATPSKKPKDTKGKGAGKNSKKGKESSNSKEKEEPVPKKQGKQQTGGTQNKKKKQKAEDDEAFKPSTGSSDDEEEEYKTAKPKGGEKAAKSEQAVNNEGEEAEEVVEQQQEEGGEEGQSSEEEEEGTDEEDDESEWGEERNNKAGSRSGSDEDEKTGKGNNQSDEEEAKESEDEEEEDEDGKKTEPMQLYSGRTLRATETITDTNIPKPSASRSRSSKSNDRSLMKRMSVENQRSKLGIDGQYGLRRAQAEKAFERQEQFKRDGSLREVQLTGIIGERKNPSSRVPPVADFNRNPYTSTHGKKNKPKEDDNQTGDWDRVEKISRDKPPKTSLKVGSTWNKTKHDGRTTEEQMEKVFPITQEELETAIASLKESDEALKKALSQGRKYRLQRRRAKKKIGALRRKVKDLESRLETAANECAQLELELAAKKAVGYDPLSYCYADPEPELDVETRRRIWTPRNYQKKHLTIFDVKEIGGAPLEAQTITHAPFSTRLIKNPFRHEDMYQRREIINTLTFPANVMLLDHSTDYYFVCCLCTKVSPANLFYFQDEIVWSSYKCLACEAHMCCKGCARWTAPASSARFPDTNKAAELLNGHKGKGNYEASLYLRGIWWDYVHSVELCPTLKNFKMSKDGLDFVIWERRTKLEGSVSPPQVNHWTGFFDTGEESPETNNTKSGLRSVGKRKIEYNHQEAVHESKRRKVEEILEKRRRARQLPFPEEIDGNYDDEEEEEYGNDEVEVVVEDEN
ncbi:hypothetical protein TWF225_011940 [Orbilia oligospora]|uniref:Uncharacterized protein n=1 Tax=Orbilia oligospora TaxID=2813651 RepID=A0A7C8PUT9_ORBOL|nr:hypothetical protein TWF225_011940 [Orbilia oligospora]KAF3180560.1 hypothetical protein TWF751_010940 [Orbilia oligospora]KAF3261917.1 hypothetical protein TWF217_004474 [Orbilia oligospora]KAF3265972.1 hypothetical protein TWF128_011543 [Orbilia oligospora]KAF3290301.1 hypothetical protein TWF132_007092 [Orbilia oligospora]